MRSLLIVTLIMLVAAPVVLMAEESAEVELALRILRNGDYEQAVELFEKASKDEPDNGVVWYSLGMAYHSLGEFDKAIAADTKAAEFAGIRASALYNLACAYSLNGDVDEAVAALQNAQAAGFLDYDLMYSDPDLDALRKQHDVDYPQAHDYDSIEARNGVVIRYHIVLPRNYDSSRAYPALLAFPPGGGGTRSADWALDNLWTDDTDGWIVIVPVAPEQGWINHPAHHAMNDMLDRVQDDYNIDGKFHMSGFGEGSRPAATFSLMSAEYFKSVTTVSGYAWSRWDDDAFDGFRSMPVHLIVGERDEYGVEVAMRVKTQLEKYAVPYTLTIVDGDGYMLEDMKGDALLKQISMNIRQQTN